MTENNEGAPSQRARIANAVFGRQQGSHAARAERLPFVARPVEGELDLEAGTITYNGETYVTEGRLDGVYRERAHLVALLAAMLPSHIGRSEPGWSIVIVEAPHGQLSWHIADRDLDLFAGVRQTDPYSGADRWDGHTTDEKYGRVREMIANLLAGGGYSVERTG